MKRPTFSLLPLLGLFLAALTSGAAAHGGDQPLANIAIHRARIALDVKAYIKASPYVLGQKVCIKSLNYLLFKFWTVISVVKLVTFV